MYYYIPSSHERNGGSAKQGFESLILRTSNYLISLLHYLKLHFALNSAGFPETGGLLRQEESKSKEEDLESN